MATPRNKPARKRAVKPPPVPTPKQITAVSMVDAQNIMAFLQRIDLKGSEVQTFNRAQMILGYVCGQVELTQEQLSNVPNKQ